MNEELKEAKEKSMGWEGREFEPEGMASSRPTQDHCSQVTGLPARMEWAAERDVALPQ